MQWQEEVKCKTTWHRIFEFSDSPKNLIALAEIN